jgi:hypothetical protein
MTALQIGHIINLKIFDMKRKIIKLTKGIVLFGIYQFYVNYIGYDGLFELDKTIQEYLNFLPETMSSILASLIVIFTGLALVYCCISGLFRICTFHQHIPQFEN